jgi:phage terminase small subunit
MAAAPLLLPDLDAIAVTRFAELVDEREAIRAELSRGYLLIEPIVSPIGEVVGERVVLNPAVPALRQLDRQLDALADRLAIVPAARAKLGLTLTTAERQAAEVDAVLANRYRKETP